MSVERALRLLDAFGVQDSALTLAELSRRAGLHKSSALRIARTLQASGYLVQLKNASWRLGPATARLGARYQVAFDLNNKIEPVLQDLAYRTKESACFYVRDGDVRNCLARVRGERVLHRVRLGEPLPLDKGSPGHVILAFTGKQGPLYDEIRKRGFHITIGELNPVFASVSAPVFGTTWTAAGALCVTGPPSRLNEKKLLELAPILVREANKLSCELSQGAAFKPRIVAKSTWPL